MECRTAGTYPFSTQTDEPHREGLLVKATLLLRSGLVCAGFILSNTGTALVRAQLTYWVDDGGLDSNNGLSSSAAWEHIYYAADHVSSGDTIKVMPGTYNVAGNQEVFSIDLPSGVILQGSETAQSSWPRIGGDANSTTIKEVFLIDATTANVSDVQLQRLYFVGENSSGKDAPASVRLKVDGGKYIIRSGIQNCYFERSEMNASGANGRPCISLEFGASNAAYFTVEDSTIYPTERGGIEVKPLPDDDQGTFEVQIRDCSVLIDGSDDAEFGIRVGGGTGEAEGVSWVAGVGIYRTVVDSTGVSSPGSDGIKTGIDYYTYAEDGKLMRLTVDQNMIVSCHVLGCSGDGIRLWVDSDEQSESMTNVVTTLLYNKVHDNGDGSHTDGDIGAGIRVRWGAPGTPWDTIGAFGYITPNIRSCLIADNDIGLLYEGFDGASLTGGELVNDTIAGNVGPGFRFDGSFSGAPGYEPAPDRMDNLIVWGNNGGGSAAQYDGTAGWVPGTQTPLTYSCWMNLSGAPPCSAPDNNHNVAVDPNFVNAASGDYHVTPISGACVVDKGFNFSSGLPQFDFEGDNRAIDGLQDTGREVDIGADEHNP